MKERIEKKAETFVYGILSLMFGAAFFFGVLYPSHSISPGTYKVRPYTYIREKTDGYDLNDVRCKFYIYERLKNR
jgi:hypothetical protein